MGKELKLYPFNESSQYEYLDLVENLQEKLVDDLRFRGYVKGGNFSLVDYQSQIVTKSLVDFYAEFCFSIRFNRFDRERLLRYYEYLTERLD